jgi:Ca2+-binding EF-hand superfamily protein
VGVLGFERLGLNERPKSTGAHGMKDFDNPSKSGVSDALNAPHRELSRGHAHVYRDIEKPVQCMPWRNSEEQVAFLRGANERERTVYRRLSEALYACAGSGSRSAAHGPDLPALLKQLDRHRCGRVAAKDLVHCLADLRGDLRGPDVEDLARKLDDHGDRSVSIARFLRLFWADQQRTPAGSAGSSGGGDADDGGYGGGRRADRRDGDADHNEAGGWKVGKPHSKREPPLPERAPSAPKTLTRHQWLRETLRHAGGSRRQFKLVAKVLKLFREAAWKGQDQLLYCLRAGDRRKTGAMRHAEFKRSMNTMGIFLSDEEYADLFHVFDLDGSGDITFDELVALLDDEAQGKGLDKEDTEYGHYEGPQKQQQQSQSRLQSRREDSRRVDGQRNDSRRDDSRRDEGRRNDSRRDEGRRDDSRRDDGQRNDGWRNDSRRDAGHRNVSRRDDGRSGDRGDSVKPSHDGRRDDGREVQGADRGSGRENDNRNRGNDDRRGVNDDDRLRGRDNGNGRGSSRSQQQQQQEQGWRPQQQRQPPPLTREQEVEQERVARQHGGAAVNARYQQEQKRRALLKGHPEATWRATTRGRARRHESTPVVARRRRMDARAVDRSGLVDHRELMNGLTQLGIRLPSSDIKDLFRCLDADGSGSVDADEICLLLDV